MQIIAKGWSLGLCLTFQIALVHFLFNDLGIAHFVIKFEIYQKLKFVFR